MNLDYIERHQTTEFKPFVVAVTGVFLRKLTRSLSSAELELAVLKQRMHPQHSGKISYLHDYTDADTLLEEAILEVANDESGDIFDNTTPLIDGVTFEVWKAASNLLKEVFSE